MGKKETENVPYAFLKLELTKKREYKHYAAILSHLKNKSKTEYYNMQFAKYKDNLKI